MFPTCRWRDFFAASSTIRFYVHGSSIRFCISSMSSSDSPVIVAFALSMHLPNSGVEWRSTSFTAKTCVHFLYKRCCFSLGFHHAVGSLDFRASVGTSSCLLPSVRQKSKNPIICTDAALPSMNLLSFESMTSLVFDE